jgi:chromosome segregation ATPase
MSKILEVMKSNRGRAEVAELGVTDRVYKALMEDARDEMKGKALAEARIEIQGELSRANTKTATAEANAARAQTEISTVQATLNKVEANLIRETTRNENLLAKIEKEQDAVKELKDKLKIMEKNIKVEQGTLTAKDLEWKRQVQELEVALRDLKGERHDLEVENSRLKGKLEAAPKPSKASKPREIPDFELEVAQRGGPGDRIQKVRIKPVRMK